MKIKTILQERKLQLFFLGYILLLVPTLSLIAQNVPPGTIMGGIAVSFGLLIVIFALSSFMTTRHIRVFYSFLLALSMIPGAIFLGYLLFANVMISEGSITVLLETNVEESKEFLSSHLSPWISLGIALYTLCPVVMICKMKHITFHRVKEHKHLFAASILLLCLFLAIEPVAQRIYFVDFYRVLADYKVRGVLEERAIRQRGQQPFEVALAQSRAPQTLLVVIGESLSRNHMSLYGYGRETNPLLTARRTSLKVYRDVVSPQVHTIPVLRSILSFADPAHPEYLTQRPSLFELFNRAGYETYLISNQPFDDVSSSYEPLLRQAGHIVDVSKTNRPDGVVLHELEQALKVNRRKVIVVHLMGSHTAYKFRYPPSFNRFDRSEPNGMESSYPLTTSAQTTIDQYDNSVLYNDWLMTSMLDMLDGQRESSVMVYFSDHGEEVHDFRDFAGHATEKVSRYMCEVPFIVWMSDDYIKRGTNLVFREDRPYSTCDLLYSLSDLAGVSYEGYDPTRSLFSPQFAARERLVGALPYESVVKSTQEYGLQNRKIQLAGSETYDKISTLIKDRMAW
ncbi:MAG: lipid A phosphoethanolamine transferase [Tannerella sp.]|jgi:heptose-I-phosphate ethanolaminephosphotransferase|nr:lipid A phosphoethanolamine transferase [Tannerella sp.]